MSKKYKRWVGNIASNSQNQWLAYANVRLTGRGDGWPGTGESRYLVGDDGKPVLFAEKQAAQDAIDAAMRNDGPWGPICPWRSL